MMSIKISNKLCPPLPAKHCLAYNWQLLTIAEKNMKKKVLSSWIVVD